MEISRTHDKIQETIHLLTHIGAFKGDINGAQLFAVTIQLKQIATSAISESRAMVSNLMTDFDASIAKSEITATSINIPPNN